MDPKPGHEQETSGLPLHTVVRAQLLNAKHGTYRSERLTLDHAHSSLLRFVRRGLPTEQPHEHGPSTRRDLGNTSQRGLILALTLSLILREVV